MPNVLTNNKFNTMTLQISFNQVINKEDVTKRALLPSVLYSGSKNYPSQTIINKKLDDLYGANLYVGSSKVGNLLRMTFTLKFIDPKVINDEDYNLKAVYNLLKDIVFNPKIEEASFDKETLLSEKKNLQLEIIRQKENHSWYVVKKAMQELYNDSIHSIDPDGYIEDLNSIDAKNLYEYYLSCLKDDEIRIYITGDVTKDDLSFIADANKVIIKKELCVRILAKNHEKQITKTEKVNQCVLVMIYENQVYQDSLEFVKMQVFNYILGGSPSSFLFRKVREEHGLCYSISSTYLPSNGLVLINMGIALKDFQKASDLVEEQISFLSQNLLEKSLIEDAIKSIKNRYLEGLDSQSTYLKRIINKEMFGIYKSKEEFFASLEEVTSEDLKEMALKFKLKLSYFLRGDDNERN